MESESSDSDYQDIESDIYHILDKGLSIFQYLDQNRFIRYDDKHYNSTYINTFYILNTFLYLTIKTLSEFDLDIWYGEIPYDVLSPNYMKNVIINSDHKIYIKNLNYNNNNNSYIISNFQYYFDDNIKCIIIKIKSSNYHNIGLLNNQEFFFYRTKNFIDLKKDHKNRISKSSLFEEKTLPCNEILSKNILLFWKHDTILDIDIKYYRDNIKIIINGSYFNINNLEKIQLFSDDLPKYYFTYTRPENWGSTYEEIYTNFNYNNLVPIDITDGQNIFHLILNFKITPKTESYVYKLCCLGDIVTFLNYNKKYPYKNYYFLSNTIIDINLIRPFQYRPFLPNTDWNRKDKFYYQNNSESENDTDINSDTDNIDKHGIEIYTTKNYYGKRHLKIKKQYTPKNNIPSEIMEYTEKHVSFKNSDNVISNKEIKQHQQIEVPPPNTFSITIPTINNKEIRNSNNINMDKIVKENTSEEQKLNIPEAPPVVNNIISSTKPEIVMPAILPEIHNSENNNNNIPTILNNNNNIDNQNLAIAPKSKRKGSYNLRNTKRKNYSEDEFIL